MQTKLPSTRDTYTASTNLKFAQTGLVLEKHGVLGAERDAVDLIESPRLREVVGKCVKQRIEHAPTFRQQRCAADNGVEPRQASNAGHGVIGRTQAPLLRCFM